MCVLCVVCVDLMKQKDELHLTYAELREKYEVRPSHTEHTHTHMTERRMRYDLDAGWSEPFVCDCKSRLKAL